MNAKIYHIKDIIEEVRALNLTPMAALNSIDEALDDAHLSVGMTPAAWVGLCLCCLVFGGIIGWGTRTITTSDRYITGMAAQYEATTRFYNERTDQLIHANEPKTKGTSR